jgi:hypothetical protein
MRTLIFALSLLLSIGSSFGQDAPVDHLKQNIIFLSADSLEGRGTGTKGERIAGDYIAKEFEKIGLEPLGDDGSFFQSFNFTAGREYGANNKLVVGKTAVPLGHDSSSNSLVYYPLSWSANATASGSPVFVGFGIEAPDQKHNDYENRSNLEGKVFIMELSSPDGMHPHSKYSSHSDPVTKIELAASKGASAVIFVNSDPDHKNPKVHLEKASRASIPVVFLKDRTEVFPEGKKKWSSVSLSVDLNKIEKTARNVVGYLGSGSSHTIALGAHYDHLGYGHEGSLYRGKPAIHNGADDNASGVAGIIELARHAASSQRDANYLFIAFSGEELGLYGSNYYCKNPTMELKDVSAMINLDMVGRLDSMVMVNGVGTSPVFEPLIASISEKSLPAKTSKSGVGPSDHTSFYLQDIPVLHFFTGAHEDYHKPTDDADKVNYEGTAKVIAMIAMVMDSLDAKGKIAFTKTKEEDRSKTPRFTVTLGVVPDYMFDGKGMRIDGVTDGKPASGAGILKGDIVVKMGEHPVHDMMSYMKGLSLFKKGESTTVVIMRAGKEMSFTVTF